MAKERGNWRAQRGRKEPFFFFKDFHSEEVMKVFSIFFWEREGTWKKTHAVDRGQSRS